MRKILMMMAGLAAMPVTALAQTSVPLDQMPAGKYELDKTHASLTWKVMHMGLSKYTARFKTFDAMLDFDPAHPENSMVQVEISPLSIETDYPLPEKEDFNKTLATGESWFDAGTYPAVTFQSTHIEKTGEDTGKLTGNLTFLGVTKPVTLDVTFNGAAEKNFGESIMALGFSAEGTIRRSEWGMNTYIPVIGDDVKVIIEAEFNKVKE